MKDLIAHSDTMILPSKAKLQIHKDKMIGKGSFGVVYKAHYVSADGNINQKDAVVKIAHSKSESMNMSKNESEMNKKMGILYADEIYKDTRLIIMPNLGQPVPDYLRKSVSNLNEHYANSPEQEALKKLNALLEVNSWDYTYHSVNKTQTKKAPEARPAHTEHCSGSGVTTFIHKSHESSISGTFVEKATQTNSQYNTKVEHTNPNHTELCSQSLVKTFISKSQEEGNSGTFVENPTQSSNTSTRLQSNETLYATAQSHSVYSDIFHNNEQQSDTLFYTATEGSLKHQELENEHQKYSNVNLNSRLSTSNQPKTAPADILDPAETQTKWLAADTSDFNLDIEHCLKLFSNMAKEVDKAHQNGILHLDVKGANFVYNDKTDQVTLIDFGVSIFQDPVKPIHNIGSPIFMAPETMLERPIGNFSTKQDIYSLGRTFFIYCNHHLEKLNPLTISSNTAIDPSYLCRNLKMVGKMPQLEKVQFHNPDNNPNITAINELMVIMQDILKTNPDKRINLEQVQVRLKNCLQQYQNQKANQDIVETVNKLVTMHYKHIEHSTNKENDIQSKKTGCKQGTMPGVKP